jgi:predicted nucleotide-binding protein
MPKTGAAASLKAISTNDQKRKYLSQSDVPSYSLEKALSIAQAIAENYGYKPATPVQVAAALGVQPSAGPFRALTGASIAYGLTEGGYNATNISITPLGMRIVRPTTEGDDLVAKREALLRPRVIRLFLEKYSGAAIPKDNIAQNVLMDMGVPKDKTPEVSGLILSGAEAVGFLTDINGRKYVDLLNTNKMTLATGEENQRQENQSDEAEHVKPASPMIAIVPKDPATAAISDGRTKKVYLSHGKNKSLIEPIKELLKYGELEAVVSVQSHTVSQPVPTKVMAEMRACGAAIIHVEGERRLKDEEGNEQIVLNDNVLIEIGAAMALFGERFILIVKEGVKLPSNLQGLLVLPYKGQTLDVEDTVKLLKAINDMKGRPLPRV